MLVEVDTSDSEYCNLFLRNWSRANVSRLSAVAFSKSSSYCLSKSMLFMFCCCFSSTSLPTMPTQIHTLILQLCGPICATNANFSIMRIPTNLFLLHDETTMTIHLIAHMTAVVAVGKVQCECVTFSLV